MNPAACFCPSVRFSGPFVASIHLQYDVYQIGTIFFIGILLGVARIRSGSLYVPLAMHTLINLLATVEAGIKIYALG